MSDSKKAYKNWKVQQGSDIIFPNQVWQAACDWKASAQDGGGGLPVGLVCQLNHHRNGWIDIQITGHSKKSTVFTVVGAGSMEYLTEAEAYDFRATPACHLENDNSPVFIRVAKKTEEGGFDFVEIETAEGIGVNIEGVQDREFHLLGPLYRQQPSAVVPEWISVKDRLPLKPSADIVFEQQEYLVTDGVIVGVCDFQRGNGAGNPWASWGMYGYGGLPRQSITHWMELPQPPNQEKDPLN
jgi:hypothetical protein